MQRFIKFQRQFLSWDLKVIALALQAGILAMIYSLAYVLILPNNLLWLWAVIGVFLMALIHTVGLHGNLSQRRLASIYLSIGAGLTTVLGSVIGQSLLWTTVILIIIVPFVAFSASSSILTSSVILFVVDLFIIGSGLPASLHVAIGYGLAFILGALSLNFTVYLVERIMIRNNTPVDQSLATSNPFVNYQNNFDFAIMLTLSVVIANIISYSFKIPQGFWVPMTVLLILKSDHDFTRSRMSHRLFGTLLGSIIAALVLVAFISKLSMALLMLPLLFFIVVAMARHYGSYTFVLTIMVTVLINLIDTEGYLIAAHRLLDTAIGVVIVAAVIFGLKPLLKKILSMMGLEGVD